MAQSIRCHTGVNAARNAVLAIMTLAVADFALQARLETPTITQGAIE
jgi:hypothetical protein